MKKNYANGNKFLEALQNEDYFLEEIFTYKSLKQKVKIKHKLENVISNFDVSLTEWENLQNNGYDRIWDLGNIGFVKEF